MQVPHPSPSTPSHHTTPHQSKATLNHNNAENSKVRLSATDAVANYLSKTPISHVPLACHFPPRLPHTNPSISHTQSTIHTWRLCIISVPRLEAGATGCQIHAMAPAEMIHARLTCFALLCSSMLNSVPHRQHFTGVTLVATSRSKQGSDVQIAAHLRPINRNTTAHMDTLEQPATTCLVSAIEAGTVWAEMALLPTEFPKSCPTLLCST